MADVVEAGEAQRVEASAEETRAAWRVALSPEAIEAARVHHDAEKSAEPAYMDAQGNVWTKPAELDATRRTYLSEVEQTNAALALTFSTPQHGMNIVDVVRSLYAELAAARTYAAGLEQCVEGLRSGEEVASMREALEESERERMRLHAERAALARDVALLAEVRGHGDLAQVIEVLENEREQLAGCCQVHDDTAKACALLVRLLRGEGS